MIHIKNIAIDRINDNMVSKKFNWETNTKWRMLEWQSIDKDIEKFILKWYNQDNDIKMKLTRWLWQDDNTKIIVSNWEY